MAFGGRQQTSGAAVDRQKEQEERDPSIANIEYALKAERDGLQLLRETKEHAGRLLSEARAKALAIAQHADARIARLHSSYLQKVERDIAGLSEFNLASAQRRVESYAQATLARAARRVAAKLTET